MFLQYIVKQVSDVEVSNKLNNIIKQIHIIVNKISDDYIKMTLKLDENENTGIKSFDDICFNLRLFLMNNDDIPISEKIIIKYYDGIIYPYYKLLYKIIIDHQIKMLNNYLKFIYNQFIDVKMIILFLCKILPQDKDIDDIYQLVSSS